MSDEGEMRDAILGAVERFPGIHFRGLVRELGTSTALARYHLDALVEGDKVRSYRVGGYVRYFPSETYDELAREEKDKLNVLRQEKPLQIVLALFEVGPMQHKDLHRIMDCSKGTLTYHLDKLAEAGLVQRDPKGRGLWLEDQEEVRRLLARFEPASDMLDEVHDLWEDLFGGHST